MGLLGIAMSRYSGCWVGMKLISDTVETTAAVDLADEEREFVIPDDFELPPDGLNLRWPDDRWSQDHRLQNYKGYAAIAFGRANGVDRDGVRLPEPAARRGRLGQGLRGRAPGAARARDRRRGRGADRPPGLQGRHALADRAGEAAPLLRRPGRGPGRRGAPRDHREPDQAVPVQLARRRAAADHRQVRPPGPAGAAARPRAHRGPRGRGPGRPHRPARGRARASPPGSRASSPGSSGAERAARGPLRAGQPAALLLLRLPPQHLDPGAGRQPRARRHRLPLHGAVDGPPHRDLHPHGRRGRALGRHGAVHRREARLRQSRRRHLLPLRHPGDPPGGRLGRQHHLQDPVQRRRRDDRRPSRRRPAERAADHPSAEAGGRAARSCCLSEDPERYRGADVAPGTELRHRDAIDSVMAGAARGRGLHRDHLRPDLRRREAPAPQARLDGGPAASGSSSTTWSARAAATARCRATASRSSRWRRRSGASG